MKISYIKQPGGTLTPADEESFEASQNLKNGEYYQVTVKLNQNYRLHKKMFSFFKFCTQHYYGDENVTSIQVEFVRKKLIVLAGYHTQVFLRNGVDFELVPNSLKYESMSPEERSDCYKALVRAAIKNVWNSQIDDRTESRLLSFM